MADKYYKVLKDNFLWETGAILKNQSEGGGYTPINQIFCKIENCTEYISAKIVETLPDYFQRVYPVNLLSKVVYKVKEEAKEMLTKDYTE